MKDGLTGVDDLVDPILVYSNEPNLEFSGCRLQRVKMERLYMQIGVYDSCTHSS
jgi:hypothetical protein